ncbi:MAG TPA: hypothetical protein VGJ84_18085, partial [Polyangiaceae bacterium]
LGAAADSELKDPSALPEPARSSYLTAGGRLGWSSPEASTTLSFHEQREQQGVTRRNFGLDARATATPEISAGGTTLVDADAQRISDARFWFDTTPAPPMDVSLEYSHTEPALFLSRQSVLAVFSTAGYDEAGAIATLRATRALIMEGSGFIQVYDGGRPGSRGELVARLAPDHGERTVVRFGYTRLLAPSNGYHSLRSSLTRRITPILISTFEVYEYFYDEPIRESRTSSVYAGSLSLEPRESLKVLFGVSVAHSPDARLDAETWLQLSYDLDFSSRRGAP